MPRTTWKMEMAQQVELKIVASSTRTKAPRYYAGPNSVILAHNHPSGDPSPSIEDFDLTERLFAAGEVIGICVSDHVVIGRDDYRSIRELRPNSSADGPCGSLRLRHSTKPSAMLTRNR